MHIDWSRKPWMQETIDAYSSSDEMNLDFDMLTA